MAQNPLSPLHKEEFHSFNSPNTHHPPSIARDGLYNRNSVRIASLSFRRLIVDIFKTLLLPAITVGFLAFCYTVQNQTVLVDGRGLVDVSPQNLAAIKSGITTISILVISLGLWPIKNLITDMRGEEFLRSLKRSKDGVDLATANSVSSISVGTFQTIAIILRRRCSPHFFIAFISGFIVIAASALAPAALSVQDALRDSDVIAFEVAAVPMSSVINMTDFGISGWIGVPTSRMSGRLQEAASISWAEAVLGLGYSFNTPKTSAADSPQYIVPLPVKLSPTTNARWITDAFVLRPSCSWERTNVSEPIVFDEPISFFTSETTMVTIPSINSVMRLNRNSPNNRVISIQFMSMEFGYDVANVTTGDVALGGHAIWTIAQPTNVTASSGTLLFDTTGIPTFEVAAADGTWEYAVLVCSPNFSIETVEVQNNGRELTVIQGQFTKQGNLDKNQGDFFFTALLSSIGQETSPDMPVPARGSQIQSSMIFGWDQVKSYDGSSSSSTTWTPMAISDITDAYSEYIQSAAKPYMTGALGTTFVPGMITESVVVFTSSKAHVAASTALLILLCIMGALSFFRSGKGEVFSLLNVTGALHKSNLPAEIAQFRQENNKANGEVLERLFEDESKDRVLKLELSAEGAEVLAVHNRNVS